MKREFAIWIGLVLVIFLFSQIRLDQDLPASLVQKKGTDIIDLDGQKVRFEKTGKGPALLLIHGTASSLDTWDAWTISLKKHFTVYRMDLPGFGYTGPNELGIYSLDSYSDFIDRFMGRMKISRASIAGNSLGGQIAWDFARRFPQKVNKLVLISPAGMPRILPIPPAISMGQNPVISIVMQYITPLAVFRKSIAEVYGDASLVNNEVLRHYYRLAIAPGNRQAFADRVKNLEEPDLKKIKRVKAPTLVLWGTLDRWIHPDQAEKFCIAISDCRKIMLEGAGHVPMEEVPAKSLKPALRFLRG